MNRRIHVPRVARSCALAVALALTGAACSGDDSSAVTTPAPATGGGPTTAPATTTAATTAPATTAPAATTGAPAAAASPPPATVAPSTGAAATTPATPAPAPATTTVDSTAVPTVTASAPPGGTSTDSTRRTLRVLVSNDDGYGSPGIDAIVQALVGAGVDVAVVAPFTQQSGAGGSSTDGPPSAFVTHEVTTLSGHPAIAVEGFPADAVDWALEVGALEPDLVVSGINEGQNLGPVVDLSGTVGAARAAAAHGIPAIAVSAGFADTIDYDVAASATLAYLGEHAMDFLSSGGQRIVNINTPSCAPGTTARGTAEVASATELHGYDYAAPADCASTSAAPADDVEAYFNGFVAVAEVPVAPAAPSS